MLIIDYISLLQSSKGVRVRIQLEIIIILNGSYHLQILKSHCMMSDC